MTDLDLPFGSSEYAERLGKTRLAMDDAEMEALLPCDPSNMASPSGHDGWPFCVHQGGVMGPESVRVVWGRDSPQLEGS